jgi:DNA-binding CsgD family transcriptional regulator
MATADDAARSIARLSASATDVVAFSSGVFDRLERAISYDGAFLAAVDPDTLLYTRAFRRQMPVEASSAFISTELGQDDVNQLRQLVRQPSPVGWLDAATHGNRMAARRYREAMRPYGLGDELRVALVLDGTCWGLLCLHRAEARAGFDAVDAKVLAGIGPVVAGALRRAMVSEQAGTFETGDGDGPGVAVLAADGVLQSTTPTAARWFAELAELDRPHAPPLPTVVLGVLAQLRAVGAGSMRGARARVRAPSGRWLTVHASNLDDGRGSIAVVVEPATPGAVAPLVIAAYGLTGRESEVAWRLLAGLARKSVAAELAISLHTVNDHIKAIFDKTGVSSAGQLRAQVFAQQLA